MGCQRGQCRPPMNLCRLAFHPRSPLGPRQSLAVLMYLETEVCTGLLKWEKVYYKKRKISFRNMLLNLSEVYKSGNKITEKNHNYQSTEQSEIKTKISLLLFGS